MRELAWQEKRDTLIFSKAFAVFPHDLLSTLEKYSLDEIVKGGSQLNIYSSRYQWFIVRLEGYLK